MPGEETENENPSITCSGDNGVQITISSTPSPSYAHTLVNDTSAVASSSRDENTRVNEMTPQDDSSLKGELYIYSLKDIWDRAQSIYENFPDMIPIMLTPNGDTALHVAVTANSATFVQGLANLMTPEDMEITNSDGNTAFCMAAISGNSDLFLTMIGKNDNLPLIRRHDGKLPVHLAVLSGRHKTVQVLSSDNLLEKMVIEDTKGLFFMTIIYGMHDVATKLFKKYPTILASARDDQKQLTALHMLVQKPLQEYAIGDGLQLLRDIWSHVRNLESERFLKLITEPSPVVLDAVKSGNVNVVKWLLYTKPELLAQKDIDGRNPLHFAVLYQQESILDFILKMEAANLFIWAVDNDRKNILHFAAACKLTEAWSVLIPIPSFQLAVELWWFKKVEKRVPRELRTMENSKGETPKDIFCANHKELFEAVKEEVKATFKYGMFVTTLFATVCAAIFNVPGGDNTYMLVIDLAVALGIALFLAFLSIASLWPILLSPHLVGIRFSTKLQEKLLDAFLFRLGSLCNMLLAIAISFDLIFSKGSPSPHALGHPTWDIWTPVLLFINAPWFLRLIYVDCVGFVPFVDPIFKWAKGY